FGAFIGRGKRVYLVAGAIAWGGEKAEAKLRHYIEPIGWIAMGLLVAGIAYIVLK
ncbi:MAG TPA: DedA family protein, partial [Arenimonas sp.]|nr:DedA family protein [Arenimonas sp.]